MLNLRKDILATLAYFDMFDYPLTYNEIFLFLNNKCEEQDLKRSLNYLVSCKMVFHLDKFYSLKNNYAVITRRNQGNKKADELLQKAKQVGAFLIKFPYVSAVGVSGSLSKNFADEDSDIDLFIITKKNRLWIARTFMHIFKKLTFLVNKQHYYCMNYYIDEEQLEIIEKNIYTAIEVATIIPLQGEEVFTAFYTANAWTGSFLPNKLMRISTAAASKNYRSKTFIEKIFNTAIGSWIEKLCMHITSKRWNKKTAMKKINARGTVMGMSADKHFAKPDPKNFQVKLIDRYKNRLSPLLEQSETLDLLFK